MVRFKQLWINCHIVQDTVTLREDCFSVTCQVGTFFITIHFFVIVSIKIHAEN